MEQLNKLGALVLATAIAWACVAVVTALGVGEFVVGVAAILALISTMTIWALWALDTFGIRPDIDSTPHEKAKRDTSEPDDARVALLLAMLTPDERAALQARLLDDLDTDGESLSLAALLAEQDQRHAGHAG